VKRVLILGGYGNFGSYIARSLAPDPSIQLLIAGRSRQRATAFAASIDARAPVEADAVDIEAGLERRLRELAPDMVIHTVGPFQGQSYGVAEACIRNGIHYVDLADGRAFVAGIGVLDQAAKAADVLVVSGASSVPCLTAAIVDDALPRFRTVEEIDYGISAAQQTNRGLATASAVLSYIGRPFTTLRDGRSETVYGWQDLHAEHYPELGLRLFGNCDIPDNPLPRGARDQAAASWSLAAQLGRSPWRAVTAEPLLGASAQMVVPVRLARFQSKRLPYVFKGHGARWTRTDRAHLHHCAKRARTLHSVHAGNHPRAPVCPQ
jgi:short subunit dehydrogenase-like uncharacterized protein